MNHLRLLQGFALFTSSVLALGAQTTSDPGGLPGPASFGSSNLSTATLDLSEGTSTTTRAVTAPAGLAPARFSNVILTQTPSNATGAGGVSSIFSSTGRQFTFGTGGNLLDPASFDYRVTGRNTATITLPGEDGSVGATTDLVFDGENKGTYTTVEGSTSTAGTFALSTIPSSAPLANVSTRTTLTGNNTAIVGFVIAGNAPRRVLIRAVGPSLAAFGVNQPLQNPTLQLFHDQQMIALNDRWGTLMPLSGRTASSELTDDTSGTTTGATGSVVDGETEPGTGGGTGAAGTTVFTGTLEDGQSFSTELATADQFTALGAFSLTTNSDDAALVATLPPGAYTVVVSRSNPAGIVGSNAGASPNSSAGSGAGDSEPDTGTTDVGGSSGSGEVLVEVYFIE